MADQEHPAEAGGPRVTLDETSHRALFPAEATRRAVHRRELASALGVEGATALAVYVACALVLVYGALVIGLLWSHGEGWPAAVLWYAFAVAAGVCGWALSGQVTKRWLRTFVGVSVVLGAILLITIGRNAHIRAAEDEARAEARSLLAAAASAGVDTNSSAESALLAMLCERGDLDASDPGDDDACALDPERPGGERFRIAAFDAEDPESPRDAARYAQQLDCLPGWTVGTFVRWTDEASSDRQVAVLSALASCEIGAVNPAAEEAAADEVGSTGTASTDDIGGDGGADPAAGTDTPGGGAPGPTDEATAAVRAALLVQRSEVTAHEAVAAGADELLTFASGDTDFAQLRFSATAWLVLGAAALLWYRRLEIRAAAHRLGPVDVQFEVSIDAVGSEPGGAGAASSRTEPEARPPRTKAEAVFKESVLRNVPEPGAIPGGEALAPVGDLVAQTDVPHRTLISGVIEAARTILATRGGFTVIFSVRPSDDGEEHVAFVRLRDTRTGNHLASHIVYDAAEEQAARIAGYWIAGWIISRSDYVPSWAQWSEHDAASFPLLPPAWSAGVQPAAQRRVTPEAFDPNAVNSLILAQRAYAFQTTPPDGAADAGPSGRGRRNHLRALEDVARAVHRAPRYPVARYRRGAALATMMFRGGDLASAAGVPPGAPAEEQRRHLPAAARLRYLLADLLSQDRLSPTANGDRDHVDRWVGEILDRGKPFPEDMRIEMLRLAAEWSNRNRVALRWSWVARLRPSERFFWHEFRRTGLERDWRLVSASELCLCAERLKFPLGRTGSVHGNRGTATAAPGSHAGDWWRPGDWRRHRDRWRLDARRWLDALRLLDARRRSDASRRLDDLRRLGDLERAVRARALQADSHWQIAYNLACLYAVRAELWSQVGSRGGLDGEATGPEAERRAATCRAVALDWLERCLDRPASGQLVREWVDADGDLDILRDLPGFAAWRARVRRMGDSPGAGGDGGDGGNRRRPTEGAFPWESPAGLSRR